LEHRNGGNGLKYACKVAEMNKIQRDSRGLLPVNKYKKIRGKLQLWLITAYLLNFNTIKSENLFFSKKAAKWLLY